MGRECYSLNINKAENKILRNLFAKEYVEKFKQGEDKWFKSKPTEKQVKSKLNNENFQTKSPVLGGLFYF